jgi:hypothetical protein
MPTGTTGSVPCQWQHGRKPGLEPMISASNATDAAIIEAFAEFLRCSKRRRR